MSLKKIGRAGNKLPIPSTILDTFFQYVLDKKFTEAEKCLQEIYEKIGKKDYDEFKRGFIQALKGILIMLRSNDQNTFLSNLDLSKIDVLKKYYSEFSSIAEDELHASYDRGYFSALAEYMLFMIRNMESDQKNTLKD
ncbi:MAG: hypothetical protein QXX94_05860 [Candidatus Bathyarchaeia archaeon]